MILHEVSTYVTKCAQLWVRMYSVHTFLILFFLSLPPSPPFLLHPITLGSCCLSAATLPPLHYPSSLFNTWMGLTEPLLGSRPLLCTSRNGTKFYSYCKPAGMGLASLGASLVTDISAGSSGSSFHKKKGGFAVWRGHHTVYIWFVASRVLLADLSPLPQLYIWFFRLYKTDFLRKRFLYWWESQYVGTFSHWICTFLTFAIFRVRGSVIHFGICSYNSSFPVFC